MFTVLFHAIRLSDKSYSLGGQFAKLLSAKMQPKWPEPKFALWQVNKGTLVLVNMLCVAFLAHYNAINYYKELDGATPRQYSKAIAAGFGTAAAVFLGTMFMGYSIFGTTAQPLILNNFHRTSDLLATCARFATGLAITFAYPLMFAGLKSSMFNLIDAAAVSKKAPVSKSVIKTHKTIGIIASLGLITAIAFKCGEEDVSVVLGIVGSVLGCGVAYVLPGYMRLMHMRRRKRQLGLSNGLFDVIANHGLVALGLLFGALGVWVTLQSAGEHHHAD
jgi:amino acid permease